MDLQDSVQRFLQNPADLQRIAKIENMGISAQDTLKIFLLAEKFHDVNHVRQKNQSFNRERA